MNNTLERDLVARRTTNKLRKETFKAKKRQEKKWEEEEKKQQEEADFGVT